MRWFIIWKLSPYDKRTLLNTVSTIIVVSHFLTFLSAKVFPEWKLNPGFGTQKKCFFPLNKSIPSIEVTNTKILWTFFRDQILSPLNGAVPWIEVSQRRGSTVLSIWKRKLTVSSGIKYFLRRPFVQLCMRNWRSKLCLPSKTWSLSVQQSFFLFQRAWRAENQANKQTKKETHPFALRVNEFAPLPELGHHKMDRTQAWTAPLGLCRHAQECCVTTQRTSGWCSIYQVNICTIASLYFVEFIVLLLKG